jgi:CBS domain-containing protein
VDCTLAWEGGDESQTQLTAVARRVLDGIVTSGFRLDEHGALASRPLFARSIAGWADAARRWTDEPDRDRGLMLLSVVVESDPVWVATRVPEALADACARAPGRDVMLRRLAAAALAERPPTGFLRDFVLHSSGERNGVLGIKRGGLLPIESLARWSGLAAAVDRSGTPRPGAARRRRPRRNAAPRSGSPPVLSRG